MLAAVAAGLLIMLDPGHHAGSPGATSAHGRPEYELNVEMARLLEQELAAAGVRVEWTRAVDEQVELEERARRANEKKAALLLSLHHDSPKERDLVPWNDAGTQRLHTTVTRGFSLHVRADKPEDVRIARAIAQALVEAGFAPTAYHAADYQPIDLALGIYDRPNLKVLRLATVPAVLVEFGFIAHREEELELRKPEVRARLVKAVARGVLTALRPSADAGVSASAAAAP